MRIHISRNIKAVLCICGLCVLLLSLPSGTDKYTRAATSINLYPPPFVGNNIPVAESSVHLLRPDVAYNGIHEEFLVVWSKWVDDYTRDIWGRRISKDGTLHEIFVIATSPGEIREDVQVAYSPVQDEYFVVYTNFYDDQSSSDGDIMATRVNWNGGWKSSEFAITNDVEKHVQPALAYNSVDDEYLVVYTNGDSMDIKAQRVDGDGTLLTWNYVAHNPPGESRTAPDVAFMANAYNGDGGYLIAYRYYFSPPYDSHINYKLAQANLAGMYPAPESQVVPGATTQVEPYVAASPDEFLVTWWQYQVTGDQIYGKRISREGVAVGATGGFTISSPWPSTYDEEIDVAFAGHGKYLVLWTANEGVSSFRVNGQYTLVEMDEVWRSEFLMGPAGDHSYGPRLLCPGHFGCLVSYSWWNEAIPNDASYDIGAQFVWPFGTYVPIVFR